MRKTLIPADEQVIYLKCQLSTGPRDTVQSLVHTWISDLPAEFFESFKVCKEVKQSLKVN